eukprot:TRINITY_DN7509_c0_g1_i7.p1 TRINITY_DN7509_c0_g1~~TRINITY_DN7509_c0_g1_i7.p1  ORF type:complete len:318 (+),score=95.09 TRINITY_DN7509_c0_g1_i7:873-1826(+)
MFYRGIFQEDWFQKSNAWRRKTNSLKFQFVEKKNDEVDLLKIQLQDAQLRIKVLEDENSQFRSLVDQKDKELKKLLGQLEESKSSLMTLGFEPKIISKYSLTFVEKIGGGLEKDVSKCKLNDRTVAVASFRIPLNQEEGKKKYQKELRAFHLSSRHPNIVQLEGVTDDNELVMEYCSDTLVGIQSSLTFVEKITFAVDICRGLAFLHRIGISHGDLKPENILISVDKVAKLSDFGFSSTEKSVNLEKAGTLRYQAPEYFSDDPKFERKAADVYALGGVLLFLFSGKKPWDSITDGFRVAKLKLDKSEDVSQVRNLHF